ncbi:hypothetical protein ACLHDG_05445 [Sulfurovum sp. CS9]|uniref:hypothetical protein n=1 Tax=Sulfurovum sp. CS9 TaxID=3391146 RepID=UPI0039ECECA3
MQVDLKVTKAEIEAMKTEKGSKLLPFKDEIIYMRNEGISFRKIQEWLDEKNVVTSTENIRQFFKRYENEFLDAEFQFKDEDIPDDEHYSYDNDEDIPDDSPF